MNKEDALIELVKEITTMTEAIKACVRQSGLTDKQIYLELGIDGGHWSRIMVDQAWFPQTKYLDLFRVCGNNIPARWLMMKCQLAEHEENKLLREELRKAQEQVELLRSVIKNEQK